jgi:adenine-specific DNA-methyltransferase
MAKKPALKTVETIKHDDAKRKNIPTAEYQSVMKEEEQNSIRIAYERRNRDLDPQLVWRGKDEQDWSDLVVQAPPLYIQEKVQPKVLIDDLQEHSGKGEEKKPGFQPDLFANFNGLPDENAKTEFYQHDAHWSNRMILGDNLQVMASLAEREGLRGKVQCIYIDPPYGIKFNSNFQWSTTSRDVKDGNVDHITREPEQVKAFRDTWRDGIHSYLTYLRDRLTVARDLLTESGSIFVQIGDENVHRVRSLMDEVFGEDNFIVQIDFATTTSQTSQFVSSISDHILWFAKERSHTKFRELKLSKDRERQETSSFALYEYDFVISRNLANENARLLVYGDLTSRSGGESSRRPFRWFGQEFTPTTGGWKTSLTGLERLGKSNRLGLRGKNAFYKRYFDDWPFSPMPNTWMDTQSGGLGVESRVYVVQTNVKVIERCILMTTDPGDLVLDPTCGSGTTAYVAEQWGRRWITIDTSRVALALARARIMGARYSYYLLADSPEGQLKEAQITAKAVSTLPTRNDIRLGFVYERVPHITLKAIANNAEIDVIWEDFQTRLEPLRTQLNTALGKDWEEWEIPRDADGKWPEQAGKLHAEWWRQRIARQKTIDASIAAKAEFEFLYDKPYEDKKKVRVAGPFTVESLSPHRVLGVDENDELIDERARAAGKKANGERIPLDFAQMILENLKTAGVQQSHKQDKITFTSLTPWPGDLVCAEGRYVEGGKESGMEKRAAIFIGPEFGTVSRPDLVQAAREAGDAGFDVLITCAFNYDAHSTEFSKLGRIQVLKARMNADLHMADDLKNTGKGNLFVIFGEPDIQIHYCDEGQIRIQVLGVEVFHPGTGEVRSDGPDGIACWFIDTDYNEESFFVRHAYFLGANDPYKALKTTLKAQIHEEAWETLHSDISRPFAPPQSGRIAVKVINHLGDEVMKIFRVV